jgi:hypothetical protein
VEEFPAPINRPRIRPESCPQIPSCIMFSRLSCSGSAGSRKL